MNVVNFLSDIYGVYNARNEIGEWSGVRFDEFSELFPIDDGFGGCP